ncbi:MAG: sporulation protein [Actinomycetota bacterium]|nr:sporulation protein [Actinomycetota bacterium]
MFKRMLSAFGVGGPSVDTVLDNPAAMPGHTITGQVRIQGGSADVTIDQIVLSLVTKIEMEHGDHESRGTGEFFRLVVGHSVQIQANQRRDVPFQLTLPWETPITWVGQTPLPGMSVGVRTELVISGAPDKGDLDPVAVHPLPAQNQVLEAFGQLGFQFRAADVEVGRIHGVPQELGFYQELEFFPPSQVAGRINQVELTFVTNPAELWIVLEADKRGGMFSSGTDVFGQFRVTHEEAMNTDWAAQIEQWLVQITERGRANPAFGGQHAPNPAFGQPQYGRQGGYGQQHGHGGRRSGPGMGAVVGGAAAGVVGGMIIGDMMSDFGDDGGGDDGGGDE